jgi:DNA-binding GntR family transcriptional regulator
MSVDVPQGRATPVIGSLAASSSLRSRVTEVLRQAMIAGELEPGQIYSAPALAERLGVSATPVREAMMELTKEGLVETLRHRGYRVVEVGDVALDEIIELRELIEVPTVGRVARVATPEQIDLLRPLADRLNETAEAGELQEFIATDMDFHLRLLAIGGNGHLVEEVRRLRGLSRLSALRRLSGEGRLVVTAQEHHDLLDLVQAGDASGAEDLMRRHLGHVRGVWAGRAEDA